MKKIVWLTAGCYLQVDLPFLNILSQRFDIEWIVAASNKSYISQHASEYAKENHINLHLFDMKRKWYNPLSFKESADVQWYNIDNIVPNVDNYEVFKRILNELRIKPIPFDRIKMFMERIYTSTRAKELEAILCKHSILINQKMC